MTGYQIRVTRATRTHVWFRLTLGGCEITRNGCLPREELARLRLALGADHAGGSSVARSTLS